MVNFNAQYQFRADLRATRFINIGPILHSASDSNQLKWLVNEDCNSSTFIEKCDRI